MTGIPKFIAVNWGSTNFRAYLISDQGQVLDECQRPDGILKLDQQGMAAVLDDATKDWGLGLPAFLNGMISSNVGWQDVPYVHAPCSVEDFSLSIHSTMIGRRSCGIIPGISCRDDAGNPDIMRGEEVEIFGLLDLVPELASGEHFIVLPGTHTKWVKLSNGKVSHFFTSMVGEVFDHLSANGLLASVLDGFGEAGPEFDKGVQDGRAAGTGWGRLLFSVRARFVCGDMDGNAAASYLRGVMLGSEIGDALALYAEMASLGKVVLVGSPQVNALYASALGQFNLSGQTCAVRDATIAGYAQIHKHALLPIL